MSAKTNHNITGMVGEGCRFSYCSPKFQAIVADQITNDGPLPWGGDQRRNTSGFSDRQNIRIISVLKTLQLNLGRPEINCVGYSFHVPSRTKEISTHIRFLIVLNRVTTTEIETNRRTASVLKSNILMFPVVYSQSGRSAPLPLLRFFPPSTLAPPPNFTTVV